MNLEGLAGLQWYYGGGAQLRVINVWYSYRYRYFYGPDSDDYFWRYGEDNVSQVDIGADGVLGLEYTFPNAPVAIFADANIFLELINNPFVIRMQSGLGVRYNFK